MFGFAWLVVAGCDRGQVKVSSPSDETAPPKPALQASTQQQSAAKAAPPATNVPTPPSAAKPAPPPPAPGTASPAPATVPAPGGSNQVAVIKTTSGEMVVEFWPDVAPKTVENFKKLASSGFYNGTCFHRIIKGFMIQGGDPLTKDPSKEPMWGTGDPGYKIDAEFNNRPHQRGVLSMARSSDPNSAGSQFFICLGDASFLDQKYTAFGKVIQGDDVLGKIGDTPVIANMQGEQSKPTVRIEIQSIQLTNRPAAK